MEILEQIRDGIDMEGRESTAPIDGQVRNAERIGALWAVWLEPFQMREHLDESLEGAAVWWPGPPSGVADILSVVPDEWQINLRFVSATPPLPGGRLRIYRPQFLAKLEKLWREDEWATQCMEALNHLSGFTRKTIGAAVDPCWFPQLRQAQRQAFSLTQFDYSFLWGPPGTGKTTALGILLASFLAQFPRSRVLLLSTTNAAVDEALISVDNALSKVDRGEQLRSRCKRVGSHFLAGRYEHRRHLLPVVDERALQSLIEAEAERPDPADLAAYAEWKRKVEEARRVLRANAKAVLECARLAAMTTTRAVFDVENLRAVGPFDLLIFDEESQVSIPHAVGLAPVARSVIFAGDPKQLGPIVQSSSKYAVKWMGNSPFQYMLKCPSACFLNEQSRMADPICRAVSHTFYRGDLVVAERERADPEWIAQRHLRDVPGVGDQAVTIIDVPEDGVWSRRYGGPVRRWSADRVVEIVSALVRDNNEDIVVLVPFRAQRSMIKKGLKAAELSRIKVSTVHRAQGSQHHTIIFDPVDGASKFILDEAIGPRLINVAISRAKARVVLLLSAGDRANSILDRMAWFALQPIKIVDTPPLEKRVAINSSPVLASPQMVESRSIATVTLANHSEDERRGDLQRLQAEIDRLRTGNESLNRARNRGFSIRVSTKGALSVYGLGRFPITLYRDQWVALLDHAEVIRTFIAAHPELRTKGRE